MAPASTPRNSPTARASARRMERRVARPHLPQCRAGIRRRDRVRDRARQARLFRLRPADEQPRLGGARARQERRRAAQAAHAAGAQEAVRDLRIVAIMQALKLGHAARRRRASGSTRRSRTAGSNSGTSPRSTCARSSSPASRPSPAAAIRNSASCSPGAFMPGATEADLLDALGAGDRDVLKAGAQFLPSSASTCGSPSTCRSTRW